MSASRTDVVVIGSGLDELVAAADLAGAGLRVTVVEEGDRPGGPAASEEILPGFRIDPVFADAGHLPAATVRDLELEKHGLGLLSPDPVLTAPADAGEGLVVWRDPHRTRASIARRSTADAGRWIEFVERMAAFARVLEDVCRRPPPRPAGPLRELAPYLGLARRVRALGRERMIDLLRVLSLPVQDLLDDAFQDEVLKGALGAVAVRGVFQGPRSPGTSLALLQRQVGSPAGVFGPRAIVRGGVGALAEALAGSALERGADIRCGEAVARIAVDGGRAVGIVLDGGAEIMARVVLSGAGPSRTLLDLAGARHLDPDFVHAVRQIRYRGGWARVHLALSEAPRFEDLPDSAGGAIVVAPGPDYVERAYDDAKHGRLSASPVLEARVPSLADPSLAPPGRHVMSVDVRFLPLGDAAPAETGGWGETLARRALELLAHHAPGLPAAVLARRVLTPADLEARYGWTGGDPLHGELALDQLLFMRPVPGWARYRTPIEGLYLCGPGTHPAGAVTGASGRHASSAIREDMR